MDDSEAKFLGVNTAVVSGAQEAERNGGGTRTAKPERDFVESDFGLV